MWPEGVSKIFWITVRQTTWWQNYPDLEHFTAPWLGIIWPGSQLISPETMTSKSGFSSSCFLWLHSSPLCCLIVLWSRHWIKCFTLSWYLWSSALHHWWAGRLAHSHLTPGHSIIRESGWSRSDHSTHHSVMWSSRSEKSKLFSKLHITGHSGIICRLPNLLWQHKFSVSRQVSAAWRTAHVTHAFSLVTRPCTRTWSTERGTGKFDMVQFKIASGIRSRDIIV